MNAEHILTYITKSRALLHQMRIVVEHCRQTAPAEAHPLLGKGPERARDLLEISRLAYEKGVIDRATLKAALQLADDWLTLDDDVLDLVATQIPAATPYRRQQQPH